MDGANTERTTSTVRRHLAELVHFLQSHPPVTAVVWPMMYDLGLSRVDFPVGSGGCAAPRELQLEVDETVAGLGVAPAHSANMAGISVVAPVLVGCGDDEQRTRFLRRIFTAEDVWCQLFSEPGAGSDLAGLTSRVEQSGADWKLNGQKVWTTMGHMADWGLLLARSSSEGTRHQGITCFALDMRTPGIEIRPLRQMTGEAEFNEVFFVDVLIPDSCRISEVDQGWKVTQVILANERFSASTNAQSRASAMDRPLEIWKSLNGTRSPVLRDRLMALWVRSCVADLTNRRARVLDRNQDPGPEFAIAKLAMTEVQRDAGNLCVDLVGMRSALVGTYAMSTPASWAEVGAASDDPTIAFLRSRANTIEGGTAEVQRNVIAERILGMPREPRHSSS